MKGSSKLIALLTLLIVISFVVLYTKSDSGSFNSEVLSDFAIEDTSSVDRIYIADFRGEVVNLERVEGNHLWRVNDKYFAKEYSVKILLEAFHDIEVKATVPEAKREHVINSISSRGTKVQIFSNGKLNKTYLIGTCAQDQKGTYMVLEHGDGTRSSEPLNMFMKRFTGCLRQRFFTEEEEWRYTGIYEYPNLGFKEISLKNHENPAFSYKIEYAGGNDIKLYDSEDRSIETFDTLKVKDYMLLYKKVHFETYNSYMSETAEDSLVKTKPAFTFNVISNEGAGKDIDIYFMPPAKDFYLPNGDLSPYDLDRMYGKVDGEELGLVQTYVFNPLLKELPYFLKEK